MNAVSYSLLVIFVTIMTPGRKKNKLAVHKKLKSNICFVSVNYYTTQVDLTFQGSTAGRIIFKQ